MPLLTSKKSSLHSFYLAVCCSFQIFVSSAVGHHTRKKMNRATRHTCLHYVFSPPPFLQSCNTFHRLLMSFSFKISLQFPHVSKRLFPNLPAHALGKEANFFYFTLSYLRKSWLTVYRIPRSDADWHASTGARKEEEAAWVFAVAREKRSPILLLLPLPKKGDWHANYVTIFLALVRNYRYSDVGRYYEDEERFCSFLCFLICRRRCLICMFLSFLRHFFVGRSVGRTDTKWVVCTPGEKRRRYQRKSLKLARQIERKRHD